MQASGVQAAVGPNGFTREEYAARIQATRDEMARRGLRALAVVSPENIYYLVGLNHQGYFAFTLLLLPLAGDPVLVTRSMEGDTVAAQAPHCRHVGFQDDEEPAGATAGAIRSVLPARATLGVELSAMFFPPEVWRRVRGLVPGLRWVDGSGIVETIRAVKSPTEIALTRHAARVSDIAMDAGIAAAGTGVSERAVAATVFREMFAAGSDYPGFPPHIRPTDLLGQEHVTWGDRNLVAGNGLFFELSACVARYHAPLSRVVYVDNAPPGVAEAAEIALAGHDAIRKALHPGALTGDVYATWEETVGGAQASGHARRHHCGYLVGIGFPPSWVGGGSVTGIRRGGDLLVREGMIFHIMSWIREPIGYVISDTALVGAAGCEVLTNASREPRIAP
ncbi:MAG: M24 family metallopeptidase [Carbonactinosporaceae bacterium]